MKGALSFTDLPFAYSVTVRVSTLLVGNKLSLAKALTRINQIKSALNAAELASAYMEEAGTSLAAGLVMHESLINLCSNHCNE